MSSAKPKEKELHPRSVLGLDGLTFLLPDVQAGVGPFLVFYTSTVLNWHPNEVGAVLTVSGFVALAAQAPGGMLIDRLHDKRWIVGAAVALVALACVLMVSTTSPVLITVAQSTIALLGAVLLPAIAAISIGLVGRARMEKRIGRNTVLAGAGSVVFALAMGAIGQWWSVRAMFFFPALMALPTIAAAFLIKPGDIDYKVARGADGSRTRPDWERKGVHGAMRVFAIPGFAILLASSVLFHVANAAVLPMLTERVSSLANSRQPLYVAGLVSVNQAVLIPVGLAAGWLASRGPRKPLFLVAFIALPVRCLLCAVTANPVVLVVLQLLDGLGAGVFNVMAVLMVADLARGSGWFNFAQGVLWASVGVGATLSNYLGGVIVTHAGFATGFLVFGAVSTLALLLFLFAMPETSHRSMRGSYRQMLARA